MTARAAAWRPAGLACALWLAAGAAAAQVAVECEPGAPRLCLAADPADLSVLVALTLPVGSADEGPGEHGLAHYVEHLTFRGRSVENGEPTPGAGAGSTAGATPTRRPGPRPTTGPCRPSARGRRWPVPWPCWAPWTSPRRPRPRSAPSSCASASRAMPAPTPGVRERWTRRCTPAQPLARPVIGLPEEIAALDPEAARAFHGRHYRAGAATLVVAGPIEPEAIREAVAAHDPLPEGGAAGGGPIHAYALDARPPETLRLEDVFGAPERTLDAVARTSDGPKTLAATGVLDAWLGSGLPGAPGPVLGRGREDVRELSAGVWEVVPGWTALGVTLTLRPSGEEDGLDAPWAAWEALWAELRRDGLDADTVARLRARLVRDLEDGRDDGQSAAWDLLAWLEAGETAEDWASYPDALAEVGPGDVRALLDALAEPARLVTADAVPAPPAGAEPPSRTPARAITETRP